MGRSLSAMVDGGRQRSWQRPKPAVPNTRAGGVEALISAIDSKLVPPVAYRRHERWAGARNRRLQNWQKNGRIKSGKKMIGKKMIRSAELCSAQSGRTKKSESTEIA